MYKIFLSKFLLITLMISGSAYLHAETLPTHYFRSVQSGAWDVANTWESSSDGSTNWAKATLVPTSEANTITIKNGHTVTIGNGASLDQLIVENGGILHLATVSSASLAVNDGKGSDITVQSGGIFRHNTAILPSFSGSSLLEVQGGGILEVANDNGANATNYANTGSDIFSHISWNDAAVFNWNTSSAPADGINYFSSNPAIPVFRISKAITMGGGTATIINGIFEANANVSFQGGGTKTFRNGITGTGKVGVTALNGGQFIINGATAQLGGTGILELNNSGLTIPNGTLLTLTSDKTINNYSGGTGTITNAGTFVAASYVISGNSKIQIDGTVKTSNANGLTGKSNTTFATATGFVVNAPGTSSTIEYNSNGNQTVTTPLIYYNLIISGGGIKTAAAGADIFVSGVLSILSGSVFALNGTNHLKLNGGGALTINANSVFDNGGESQVSGGGNPTINIYGTFITRDAQGFTGTNTSIPGATTSPPPTISVNIFSGSTIEYGRPGDQTVSSRNDYRNMTFSGSGIKTLNTFSPAGTVLIKDNAVVDAGSKTFGDAGTNLTMTGGRFKVGSNGTKPDIAGTYSLQGGVIEFTNGGATKQTMRATIVYANVEITGTNVYNSLGNTTIANGGSFTVKKGGIFENTAFRIDGTTGTQTFILEAGSIFKTGTTGGFSGDDNTVALKGFETLNIDPKATIFYSRLGDQTITPFSAYPTLLLKGSGNKTVTTGTITLAATADSMVIDPAVVFKMNTGAKADFNNRPVFIKSTAGGTGMIGVIADGSSALLNATNVTVERYIPSRRAYRFLSPTVNTTGSIKANWMEGVNNTNPYSSGNLNPQPGYGTHITGNGGSANGFDPTLTNNPSLYTFNNLTQKWEAIPNTGTLLKAANAYRLFIRGSRSTDLTTNTPSSTPATLRSTGAIVAGSVTFDKSSNSPVALSAVNNNFSFIGNPYASSVDWEALVNVDVNTKQVTGTARDIAPTYCTWDPNINTRGSYVYYNAVTHSNNIGVSKVNKYIQPGQGFFVQAVGNNPDPALQFKEVSKATSTTNVFRTYSNISKISVQLLLANDEASENIADGVTAFFHDDFTFNIENEDSHKLPNLDENLSITRNGTSLSMEGRPLINSNDSINLKISQLRQQNYFLRIESANFSPNVAAFLWDSYLMQETPVDLSNKTILPFSLTKDSASFAPGRFAILFKAGNVLSSEPLSVNAYIKGNGIEVEWSVASQTNIAGYEVQKSTNGRQFVKATTVFIRNIAENPFKYSWMDENTNPGSNFYRIKTLVATGSEKLSNIVKVEIARDKSSFTIFPNPVKDNVIKIIANNLDIGNYIVNIYNDLLQNMYTTTLSYTGGYATYPLKISKVLPKGIYHLQAANGNIKLNKTIKVE